MNSHTSELSTDKDEFSDPRAVHLYWWILRHSCRAIHWHRWIVRPQSCRAVHWYQWILRQSCRAVHWYRWILRPQSCPPTQINSHTPEMSTDTIEFSDPRAAELSTDTDEFSDPEPQSCPHILKNTQTPRAVFCFPYNWALLFIHHMAEQLGISFHQAKTMMTFLTPLQYF